MLHEKHVAEKREFEAGYTAKAVSDALNWLDTCRAAKKGDLRAMDDMA